MLVCSAEALGEWRHRLCSWCHALTARKGAAAGRKKHAQCWCAVLRLQKSDGTNNALRYVSPTASWCSCNAHTTHKMLVRCQTCGLTNCVWHTLVLNACEWHTLVLIARARPEMLSAGWAYELLLSPGPECFYHIVMYCIGNTVC